MNEITNLKGEIWKPVTGYEGKYEVSNMGRVKSLNYGRMRTQKVLKSVKNEHGYLVVNLWQNNKFKTKRIHRLVYEAFIGNLPDWVPNTSGDKRLEINHKNENKTDNRLENLELVTCTENNNYGTHRLRANGLRSKKVYQYTPNGILVKIWPSATSCKEGGFLQSNVSMCCNNRFNKQGNNRYKGFVWSYIPLS